MEIGDFSSELKQQLERLRQQGAYRELLPAAPTYAINLSGNDYLGLAQSDLKCDFLKECQTALYPLSASSSRLLSGNCVEAEEVERLLSSLYGGSALLFNSGYHANIGILSVLAGKDDLIVSDKLVHASLIDGATLSSATHCRFRHNDVEHLKYLLKNRRANHKRLFIVCESLYSMGGDFAPLEKLVSCKREFDGLLYVDEAHAVGVVGEKGLGKAEEQGVLNEIDLFVGTLGKALASMGAFLIASPTVRHWLINHSRSLIYSTALPPMQWAWTCRVLNQLPHLTRERGRLQSIQIQLRQLLMEQGLSTEGNSHIVPIISGSNELAIRWAEKFQKEGICVLPIRHPTVPKGKERVRLSVHAALTDEMMNKTIQTIRKLKKEGNTLP